MRLGARGWECRCSSGILGVLRQEQEVATGLIKVKVGSSDLSPNLTPYDDNILTAGLWL
jgi:hypothetical protein